MLYLSVVKVMYHYTNNMILEGIMDIYSPRDFNNSPTLFITGKTWAAITTV